MTTTDLRFVRKPYRLSRQRGCGHQGLELLARSGEGFTCLATAPHDTEGARRDLGAMIDAANAAPAMLAALRASESGLAAIIATAPDDEPEYPEDGDTEDCENWGQEQAAWEAAELARPALATVRAAIAAAEGRA